MSYNQKIANMPQKLPSAWLQVTLTPALLQQKLSPVTTTETPTCSILTEPITCSTILTETATCIEAETATLNIYRKCHLF